MILEKAFEGGLIQARLFAEDANSLFLENHEPWHGARRLLCGLISMLLIVCRRIECKVSAFVRCLGTLISDCDSVAGFNSLDASTASHRKSWPSEEACTEPMSAPPR